MLLTAAAPAAEPASSFDPLYLILAACAVILIAAFLLIRNTLHKKQRNAPCALARTARLLKKLGGPGSESYTSVLLRTEEGDEHSFELINVASDRVYAVKVFPFGRDVLGNSKEENWQFSDKEKSWNEPNPLPDLERGRIILTRHFIKSHLRNIPVQTLVVFADRSGRTRFRLPSVSGAAEASRLKAWRKASPLNRTPIDMESVKAALEAGFVKE